MCALAIVTGLAFIRRRMFENEGNAKLRDNIVNIWDIIFILYEASDGDKQCQHVRVFKPPGGGTVVAVPPSSE